MVANKTKDRQAIIESLKLKVGNHQAHYPRAGSGDPVVLIHGGASDSRDWVGTMTALCHRYRLYAPDLIGVGLSDRNQVGFKVEVFLYPESARCHPTQYSGKQQALIAK